ncbi:MAG: magnesium transporter [Hydrogenothermaceae bacterium]|nr:magnesium transporter [Hydrogenothermaceae bacterium]
MINPVLNVLKDTIVKAIGKGDYRTLERVLVKTHKGDIAEVLKYIPKSDKIKLISFIFKVDSRKATQVFLDLDDEVQIEILRGLTHKEAISFLIELPTSDIARLVENLPQEVKNGVLEKLEDEEKEKLERILKEGENSVASIVREEFVSMPEDLTVEQALNTLKEITTEQETIYIYIIDEKKRLVGVVSLLELIKAPLNAMLKDIMVRDVVVSRENQTKEEAIELFSRYDLYILPVIDEDDVLKGVIYIEDIINIISEKTTEDFFKMAGAQEEEMFYSNKILKIAKLRMPWLLIATFGEIITALIMDNFRFTIESFLPIVFFIPMVAALSGNISSQTAIITARGLSTGKLSENVIDYVSSVLKEVKVAMIVGFFISLIVGSLSFLWMGNHLLGVIVGVSMFFSITVAAITGSLIPYITFKLNKDPTLATGPITLTMNDIIGIFIYLGIATYFIHYLKL